MTQIWRQRTYPFHMECVAISMQVSISTFDEQKTYAVQIVMDAVGHAPVFARFSYQTKVGSLQSTPENYHEYAFSGY